MNAIQCFTYRIYQRQRIRSILFLETASRVGGAHLAEMVEAASGINLWAEWARLEITMCLGENYKLPKTRSDNAGIIVFFLNTNIRTFRHLMMKRLSGTQKPHHVGIIIRSRIEIPFLKLLDAYAERIKTNITHHYRLQIDLIVQTINVQ